MNVSMPIAAVMLDLGFAAAAVKAVPILARTASLLAHLAEEQRQPIGFLMARRGRGGRSRTSRAPADARARRSSPVPGRTSSRSTTRAYREQLAYLFERSAFYREKLARRRLRARRRRRAASPTSASCPLTEKPELQGDRARTRTRSARTCACARDEIVRIYSTSGTTGTPSYIPLTAGDLDNWVTGSARSYARVGREPRASAIVSTYNAGPFAAGAALAAFDRIGLCHIPVGTGNTERLMPRDRAAAARRPPC